MEIAIIGGGISGDAIAERMRDRGITPRLLSRTSGFDALADDPRPHLDGVDAVIEAQGQFTTSKRKATEFFATTSANISRAAADLGLRHTLLSIVNCDSPELVGYGYFAGKVAGEKAARTADPAVTIVRSTQWHEFAAQNQERLGFGPVALIPTMLVQPIALDEVAEALIEATIGDTPRGPEGQGPVVNIAGPESITLLEMTRMLAPHRPVNIPIPVPGAANGFRAGAALPQTGEARILGPSFSEWVASHRAGK